MFQTSFRISIFEFRICQKTVLKFFVSFRIGGLHILLLFMIDIDPWYSFAYSASNLVGNRI